jgi:hypothetical protein
MGTPIYKISSYVDWQSQSPVAAIYAGGGSSQTSFPPAVTGVDGVGVEQQVAFFASTKIIEGDKEFTYDKLTGIMTVSYIHARDEDSANSASDLMLKAGDGGVDVSGNISVFGGDATSSNNNGGDVYLSGGAGNGSGIKGKVYVSDGTDGQDIYAHDFILIP